jgi:DNA topoisomerase-1
MKNKVATLTDPVVAAKAAGLCYVSDDMPGIYRKKAGKGFSYVDAEGRPVRDPETLERIKSLGIPPAYTDVWICALPNGHLQATGLDARRRKQYRYHPEWRAVRDETKYAKMIAFGAMLPHIRKQVEADLRKQGLPKEKVLASLVRLLEATRIRVGNEEYAKANKSYGLTTFKNKHVAVEGNQLTFKFRGKSGKFHAISLQDKRIARIVCRLQDLPGQDLFQYLDDQGETQTLTSSDVNTYIQSIAGEEFTAKDFRTWAGSVSACQSLLECERCDSESQAKRMVAGVIKSVAERLGNTPAICRKCYVHPAIVEEFISGHLHDACKSLAKSARSMKELLPEEALLVAFLKARPA